MARILTADFAHETNTFSVVPTTMENFREQLYVDNPDDIVKQMKGTKTTIGATFEAADEFGWNLTTTVVTSSNPTGKITDDTFGYISNLILSPLIAANSGNLPKFDGLLLHLHGAMVTDSFQDAEGELLRRIRVIVGSDIPIFVTLDLHANVTSLMASEATALVACRTYPHIDFYEVSWLAARLLDRTLKGEIRPRTVIEKRPMLRGMDGGNTHLGPMKELLRRGQEAEDSGAALVVSVCAGFTGADIWDIGPSVTVTYDSLVSDGSSATALACSLMDYAWENREYNSFPLLSVPQALDRVQEILTRQQQQQQLHSHAHTPSQGPVILAEVTDNPGSGHYGDSTALLREIILRRVHNSALYAIYDPEAVKQGLRIGLGRSGWVCLGGWHDPSLGGGPLRVRGRVVSLSDGSFQAFGPMGNGVWQHFGLSMLLRVFHDDQELEGGEEGKGLSSGSCTDVCVISHNGQALDQGQLISLGCDPSSKSVLVLKSKQHFRAAFGPMASEILLVDGGGLGSSILGLATNSNGGGGGGYKNVRRPIWPLDEI